MSDIRDDVAAGFAVVHGHAPTGIWSAPGRVNLIGEHTDYNEGFVLPFAINRRTVVALGPRSDGMLRVGSAFADELAEIPLRDLAPDRLRDWSAYPLGVAWALGEFGADLAAVPGVDLYIESTVPVGAGLSSSAAIECAVAVALNEVWQLGFDRQTLARVGQLAENKAVGAPTGIMDQSAALLGREDHALFLDCRSLESELVDLGFAQAGLELLIIDTGVSHDHATGGYASRRASCEAGAAAMSVPSLRHLTVDDLPRVLRQVHRVLKPDAVFVIAALHPVYAMFGDRSQPTTATAAYGATGHTFSELYMAIERSNFHLDTMHELKDSRARDPLSPTVLVLRTRKQGV